MDVSIILTILSLFILTLGFRFLNWVWFRPKRLQHFLLRQGLSGNPYRFLVGDLDESKSLVERAYSTPLSLSDDLKPRVQPLVHHVLLTHGKRSFSWEGPIPRVFISDPPLIKEIFSNYHDFQKPNSNPLANLLVKGILRMEGDNWSVHRKILNPAFHLGKLKVMLPAIHSSSQHMIFRWEEMLSGRESCEDQGSFQQSRT
ncbi:hypothetical protein MLD38_035126 [Melastoma candidum]|uniref:Uncharacterized protein n=1 Tax=Melastoma candidum TaxID=119954 RepID=A0ACB9MCJ6_9MYRT|nr:hypothetical protein MLD38_035126 [Melastoma candidum]